MLEEAGVITLLTSVNVPRFNTLVLLTSQDQLPVTTPSFISICSTQMTIKYPQGLVDVVKMFMLANPVRGGWVISTCECIFSVRIICYTVMTVHSELGVLFNVVVQHKTC